MPLISIIVPVYNVEPYINRCVDSILSQTFQEFELILINDGSTDNSSKICDEYAGRDARIHVIHEKNLGQSVARNAGIDWAFSNSKSEWIVFVDSDDWLHTRYLELLYGFAIEKKLNIVCCERARVNEYITPPMILNPEILINTPEWLFVNDRLDICPPYLAIYKKELFSEIRFPEGVIFEDVQTIPKVLYTQKKLAFIKEKLYYQYSNPTSTTNSQKTPKWINDLLRSLMVLLRYFEENNFIFSAQRCFMISKFCFCDYIKKYGMYKDYRKVFLDYYSEFEKIINQSNGAVLPQDFKLEKYGFRKWFTGQADELENMKNDIKAVSSQRGKLFASLWGLKTQFKIHRFFSQLPV